MPRKYTQEQVDLMIDAVTRHKNRKTAADELGFPRTTVLGYTKDVVLGSPQGGGFNPHHAHKHPERVANVAVGGPCGTLEDRGDRRPIDVTPRSETTEPALPATDWEEKGDVASVSFVSDKQIRTIDEAVQYGGVDTSVWIVKSWRCGAWTTNMKLRQGQGPDGRWRPEQGVTKQNWKVHLDLARILPKPFMEATDALFERMKGYTPGYPAIHRAVAKNPSLLVADLFDVHFGKLAWARESSQDYDLKIAETIFADAVEDILDQAVGREIEQVLIPVGNDYFHIDGVTNATTGGTVVDTEGRYPKIIEVGEMSMVRAIERARRVAKVVVKHVPGNHDRTASLHLCRFLHAWFRNCPDVEIDYEPMTRKYVAYGLHLIGMTHGNEEKAASLPLIMATEAPGLWAASEFREIQCGHFHSPKQMVTRPVGSQEGVRVRHLHSLSAVDSWHYRRGYVGGKRAAEAFLYDGTTGNVNGIEVSLRRTA